MWPLFSILKDTPLLVLRGELSRMLTVECLEKMQRKKPDMHTATIPRSGHAPSLNEAESIDAIDRFLAGLG